jgi:nanoRNase/pAp phosphatase (c-di-AMP/oligoRNAs hydrolase)
MDIIEALRATDSPLLVTHRHADRDTLGSAIGLRELLGRGTICTPDGVARPAQPLLETFDTDPITRPREVTHDAVVVLDAPSAERIAPVDPSSPILVDHHEPDNLASRAVASLVDTDAGATAELVFRVIDTAGWELSPEAALPLLVGLLDDTGFLMGATPRSVTVAVELVGALNDRSADLPQLLDRSRASGEQSARALGTLRAAGYRAGDFFVAVTHVGGYETAAAHALRDAGIELAVVCSEQADGLRVTMRASEAFVEHKSLGGDILPALTEEFGGDGGGHAGAGVAELHEESIDEVEAFLIAHLESELGLTLVTVA